MLACRDYEAMEIALACHVAYADPAVPFFILQNCDGDYDAARTLGVARRYEGLFPDLVRVIQAPQPGPAYRSIAAALASDAFAPFDLICKVDDDAFPIAAGWLGALTDCWQKHFDRLGDRLAYVTPLINNNTWGFPETIAALGLEKEYFTDIARRHRVGSDDPSVPFRVVGAEEIVRGANGTIWGNPFIARWLHSRTTMDPERFIAGTKNLEDVEIPSSDRYSIGCILFRKELWKSIDDGGSDDENMLHHHCAKQRLTIVARRRVPFIHLNYFTQRAENCDLNEAIRAVYEPRLGHPFPIALHASRLIELEMRLRWLERRSAQRPEKRVSVGRTIERNFRRWLYAFGLKRHRP